MNGKSDQSDVEKVVKGLKEAQAEAGDGLPPVHKWKPERKYDLDMRIARDGTWLYQDSPISRERLVKLFSSILRREPNGDYSLVTPVEQARITVEDVPFIAGKLDVAGEGEAQTLAFTTTLGDVTVAGSDHPMRFEIDPDTDEPAPYVHVRGAEGGGLEARLSRPVFYELAELGVEHDVDGETWFGVWSDGVFFKMQRAAEVKAGRA